MKTKFAELIKNKKLMSIIATCLAVVIITVVVICCVVHSKKEVPVDSIVSTSEETTITQIETTNEITSITELTTLTQNTTSATLKPQGTTKKINNESKTTIKSNSDNNVQESNYKNAKIMTLAGPSENIKSSQNFGGAYVKSVQVVNIRKFDDSTTAFELKITVNRASSMNDEDYKNAENTNCLVTIESAGDNGISTYTVNCGNMVAEESKVVTSQTLTVPSNHSYMISVSGV